MSQLRWLPVVSANHGYVETLRFFTLQFLIPFWDNTVVTILLGLGTNTIWLGLGKHHVLA